MTNLFLWNFTSILCQLQFLFTCIRSPSTHRTNLYRPLEPFIINGTIILKKFNEVADYFPNAKMFFKRRFINNSSLSFELYPNFTFNPEYFDDILNKDNLKISIRFNKELKDLAISKEIISNEYVDRFLEKLLHIKNLKNLDLRFLSLSKIPKTIYKFVNLEELNVEYNELDNLELDWKSLLALKLLKIGFSKKITKLNESIFNLPSLRTLMINDCSISEIPAAIDKLRHLEILEIIKTPIKSFPGNLSNLKKLVCLTISDCELEEIIINMNEHPELASVNLSSNYSLKYLKLLILEIPRKLNIFDISFCHIEKVEILVKLKSTKFRTLNCNNQQLKDDDNYLIKFNPTELFRIDKNHRISEFKIYKFDIKSAIGSNKTILIKEFNLEKTKTISKKELIAKWNKIYKKIRLESKVELKDKYIHSVKFLKNLYLIKSNDYSNWSTSFPFEYKEKMIVVLSNLFDKLDKNILESQVRSILKIFKRPHSEQLIYFNYLLKYSELFSHGNEYFITFVEESIEILKDYVFITFLSLERYEQVKSLKLPVIDYGNKENFFTETSKNKAFQELLNAVISAKRNFDSKFDTAYFSDIICNVFAIIDDSTDEYDETVNYF